MPLSINFEDLTSPHYSIRSEANGFLQASRDVSFLDDLLVYIKTNEKEDLFPVVINVLGDILNEVHEKKTKWSLVQLLYFVSKEKTSVSKLAYDIINDFFMNPAIFNHFKTFVIKSAWPELGVYQRLVMTRIISKNKFSQLSGLLVGNFDLNNTELTIETIKAFRLLKDKRGNRFIDDYISSKNLSLQEESIRTLGITGGFFDGFKLIPYLNSFNKSVYLESISSVRKLLGNFSVKYLVSLFHKTDSKSTKIKIIKELGYLDSRKAFDFLVLAYKSYNDEYIRLEIEHSLDMMNIFDKSYRLVKLYSQLTTEEKCNYAGLLDTFHTVTIEDYIIDSLQSETDKLLIAFYINLLSSYHSLRAENTLREIAFSLIDDNNLRLYAYDSLLKVKLKQNSSSVTEFPPDSLDIDLPQHQLYLTYLTKVQTKEEEIDPLCNYILLALKSNNIDNTYKALSCLKFVNNKASVLNLVEIFKGSKELYLGKSSLQILSSIFYRNAESIDNEVISQLPVEIYKDLNPYLISIDLLKKLILYISSNGDVSLQAFLYEKRDSIKEKASKILIDEKNEQVSCGILKVFLEIGIVLDNKADKKIKRLYFQTFELRSLILKYFLLKGQSADYDFLVPKYSVIMKNNLSGYLNKYLDELL